MIREQVNVDEDFYIRMTITNYVGMISIYLRGCISSLTDVCQQLMPGGRNAGLESWLKLNQLAYQSTVAKSLLQSGSAWACWQHQ